MYAFAEPIMVQQGAIEHAYKLIACLFTSVFKSGCGAVGRWRVDRAAAPKTAKASYVWGAASMCPVSRCEESTGRCVTKQLKNIFNAVEATLMLTAEWEYSTQHILALVIIWEFRNKCWSSPWLSFLISTSIFPKEVERKIQKLPCFILFYLHQKHR